MISIQDRSRSGLLIIESRFVRGLYNYYKIEIKRNHRDIYNIQE